MIRLITMGGLFLFAVAAPAQSPQTPPTTPTPTKILGGAFDPAFQELAPQGGLLIGFEISLAKFLDREVIRSLRPIYRTAKGEEINGKQYGVPEGQVHRARAKAGYAVGGVKVRTGLLIDGMSVVFMKTNGITLDRSDAYETVWIGNQIGGSTGTLAGDGTPIVGFSAKVKGDNKECSGMGLILKGGNAVQPQPAVAAGAGNLTRANFNRLFVNMTEAQVAAILGPPQDSATRPITDAGRTHQFTTLTWRQNNATVTVTFWNGKLSGKNWVQNNPSGK